MSTLTRPETAPSRLVEVDPAVDLGELLDALPSLVAFVDADERTQYANRAARRWLGRGPDEVVGRTVRELVGEESYAVLGHHARAALLGSHVTFERTMVLPRGDIVHALIQYVPYWRGNDPDGFTVLVTDVTRQVLAETAHAEGQRRVQELLLSSQAAAGRTDDVLQELFAISLHLDRMRRFPDRAWTDADLVIDSVSDLIESLRATLKKLAADVDRVQSRSARQPGG